MKSILNSLKSIANVNEHDEEPGLAASNSTPDLFKQSNEQTRKYSISSNKSNKYNINGRRRHNSNSSNSSRRHNSSSTNTSTSIATHISVNKICIGDKVKISFTNKVTHQQFGNAKGTVMYIGYPYINKGVRYGINLDKANGENDGCLMLDIKTGKLAKPSHLEKYKKRIKKRKFFRAKTKHAIFIKKEQIKSIERLSTSVDRFSINDNVEVRFRGVGKIKFIGSLEHIKQKEMGVWYGIHLVERRGRHDGTVNGVKYFQCPPQYGLHCRQNHLKYNDNDNDDDQLDDQLDVIDHDHAADDEKEEDEKEDDDDDDDDDNDENYDNHPSSLTSHPKSSAKPQRSVKWAKLMGVTDASTIKGFKPRRKGKSTMNLMPPMSPFQFQITESESQLEPDTLRLVSISNQAQAHDALTKMISISNIIPADAFRPSALSVHVLPGIHKKKSAKSTGKDDQSKHNSIKGKTTVVLPGYYEKIKKRKFFDYFDFDEIEDELGEGEFGVVYKCRKIENYVDDDDDKEYSTTFQTETTFIQKQHSVTNTGEFPGQSDSDSEASYTYSSLHQHDETVYAVKKIKKAKFHHLTYQDKQKAIKLLQQEIKLLEKIQRLKQRQLAGSNYVIDLVDVFEDRNYLYIVTNFCSGGNLWKYIEDDSGTGGHSDISEQRIQCIMKQILQGLQFLHSNDMAHLDLKPDNIMFNANKEIQLIDFGMSRIIPPLTKAGVLVGTPNFVAPEVIDGFYDKKADIWSIGVLFFLLRFGFPPFFEGNNSNMDSKTDSNSNTQLFEQIKRGFNPVVQSGLGAWFPSGVPVSDELKHLLSGMLKSDVSQRYTAAECLAHAYFSTLADSKQLPITILNAFTKFSGQCHFKVMIARLFAHQIDGKQRQQLAETWKRFDIDGDGSLTLQQFKKVMSEYETGYADYQLEAIFENLDWNETDTINFDALVTAFSYQRLVAVDERLWEAFARLDVDNDGHITKAEIKRCLATVNPSAFDEGIKQLQQFKSTLHVQASSASTKHLSAEERRKKNISVFIGDCIVYADWDDDGQIDYEEFLRALHPKFNEGNITPPASHTTDKSYIFPPSIGSINHQQIK